MAIPTWAKLGTQINMNPGANGKQRGSRMLDELVWKTETEGFITDLFASAFNANFEEITGAYSMTSDDIGKTLYVTANTQMTMTIAAASTYGNGFFVIIVNQSNNVCFLSISGVGTRKLWPGDTAILLVANSRWSVTMPRLYYAPSNTRQYIDQTNGNDANDGLTSSTALASLQKGIRNIEWEMDCSGAGVQCYFMGSAHTEGNVSHTFRVRGYHVISIASNLGISGFTWTVPTLNVGLTCRDYSAAVLSNMRMVGGTSAVLLSASQTGILDWGQMDFGPCPGGTHIQSVNGGSVGGSVGTGNIVSGNATQHLQVAVRSSAIMTGIGYQIAAGLTFGQFIDVRMCSTLTAASVNFVHDGGGPSSTAGYSIAITSNSAVSTNAGSGVYPGASGVTTATGGVLVS